MARVDNKPRTKLPRSKDPEPAPGHLEILQDFLNTRHLGNPRDLGRWFARHRLLSPGTELTEQDLRRALEVRQGLHALVRSNSGHDLDSEAVNHLDQAAHGAHLQVRFDPDGHSRFESSGRTVDEALGYLFGLVMLARAAEHWSRFKLCADDECQAAFYDFSKNGKGKWCTTRCGDRLRSRKYRRTEKYKNPTDLSLRLTL